RCTIFALFHPIGRDKISAPTRRETMRRERPTGRVLAHKASQRVRGRYRDRMSAFWNPPPVRLPEETTCRCGVSLLGRSVCPNLEAGDRITILGVSSANAIYETVFGGPGQVAKVDYAGVHDGVGLYLHGFIVTGDGSGPLQPRALRIAPQMRS